MGFLQAATGQAVLGGAPLWHPSCLAGFVGVSGAYDLEGLAAHLHRRGLYKNLLDTIMSIDGQVGTGRCGCTGGFLCFLVISSRGSSVRSRQLCCVWLPV